MNKKFFGIIGVLAVIIVVIGVYMFSTKHKSTQNETVAVNKMSITIKGYTMDINSKEVGHASSKSYFNTSFDIIDKDNNKCTYYVDFVDLNLISDNTGNDGIIDDIARPKEITINGKKFEYYLDESNWNATLYYRIPDGEGQLIIKVSGGGVFDSEGNQAKMLAYVDEKVLESDELAEILKFSVHK